MHFRVLKGNLLLVLLETLVLQDLQDCLGMEVQDHKAHQELLALQEPHHYTAQLQVSPDLLDLQGHLVLLAMETL